ncbi:MAG: SDR family oxidoreductase [Actinomycetota bacterium]|nr:SDR family oxidoreductase [Actinomycetota bacterium]
MPGPRGVAVVTGGSRGIGAATAHVLAGAGFDVCVDYVCHEREAGSVVARIEAGGGRAVSWRADVSSEPEVCALFARADALGPVTALVNCAGVTGGAAGVLDVEADQVRRACAVNVVGTALCMREAARRMATSRGGTGGAIVNVSSTAARTSGCGEWVHYAATKASVDVLTVGAARELAPEGIRVNAVAPGLIQTDLHADNGMPERPERLRPTIPMGRLGTPAEVASAVRWLVSEETSYVSGAVVEVCGAR